MSELAPSGGGPNRLFVILALGLGGLLVLVALIAVVCIAAVTALGTGVQGTFNNIAGQL